MVQNVSWKSRRKRAVGRHRDRCRDNIKIGPRKK
jgi:hypothetical protein